VLIFGSVIALGLIFRKKDNAAKECLLRLLCYALVFSYISDFFFHEFVYGGLNMDKLPFHICTVLCPLAAIAQFNRKGDKIREPVVMLAVLSPMMYLCYPASVGDGEPWCYQAVQTMYYHGMLMAWGILTLALGAVKPQIRNCWKSGILLVCITLWAKLGNICMEYNWFFLEEDAFYIGLVEGGIIPKWALMVINPVVFFLVVLCVYGICYLLQSRAGKKTAAV
jgi:uncharacterized membrane protein YwaF